MDFLPPEHDGRTDYEDSEGYADAVDLDHERDNSPLMTAFMRRDYEIVWISAYAATPRSYPMIVETYPAVDIPGRPGAEHPGVIREVPMGRDIPLSERFADSVLRHESEGWACTSPNATGDRA